MTTMTYPYQSQLRRMWQDEGRVEEAAIAVLRVLEARGLTVPDTVARWVRECTDRTILEDLLTRAVTIEHAEDLFPDAVG